MATDDKEVETLLAMYSKTMQEQVSLASVMPRLLMAGDTGNDGCFDAGSQGGLYRTLKMKGRLLDAVNARLASQQDALAHAIRKRKAHLDAATQVSRSVRYVQCGGWR